MPFHFIPKEVLMTNDPITKIQKERANREKRGGGTEQRTDDGEWKKR
jgi:hypothetical protein